MRVSRLRASAVEEANNGVNMVTVSCCQVVYSCRFAPADDAWAPVISVPPRFEDLSGSYSI